MAGGLNKLAEDLEVERIGPEHQAGSDSLLTQATFYKMRQLFSLFDADQSGSIDYDEFCRLLLQFFLMR